MKIIILAAGKGERLMPLTRNTPKSLLYLQNGRSVLETQLEKIEESGVMDKVIIIIGYLGEQIEAKLKNYGSGMKIKTIYNPFYEISNNLHSLWLSKFEMNDDFIITNGDNILEMDVYRDLVRKTPDGIVLTINKKEGYDDDDMKVVIKNNCVERVSKLIDNKKADAESVGLVKVSGEKSINLFKDTMEELVRNKNYFDKFWLEVFNALSNKGFMVKTFEIDGEKKWQEIDFHLDLEKARDLLGVAAKNKNPEGIYNYND